MLTTRTLTLLAALLAIHLAAEAHAAPQELVRVRRQLADDNTLQPLDDENNDEQAREKRKLEGVTQAKFGIKNAVLGFVFGKINSLIDSKTRLVETLDRQNIELNKQYGIEPPKGGGLSSLSGIVGQVLGPKLQFLGPKIQAVSGLFGASSGSSGGNGGSAWRYVEPPATRYGIFKHWPNPYAPHHGLVQSTEQPPNGFTGTPAIIRYTTHPDTSVNYSGQPDFAGYTQQTDSTGYTGQPEVYGYTHQYSRTTAVKNGDTQKRSTGHEARKRHPSVRSQQGQLGLPREPVWTIRVASNTEH